MNLKLSIKICMGILLLAASFALGDPVYDHLLWSDEFNAVGVGPIDSTKWFHQTQLPAGGSWYNGEIQHYTDRMSNSYVYNGDLHIVAKKETFTDQGQTKYYTSARLNSKFSFLYGRIEVRAKLPAGVGTWPAIWMLGKNINEDGAYWDNLGYDTTPWPDCGEIDIMEHWGTNQNYVQSAIHTPSSYGGTINKGGQVIPTASSDYHVYAIEWDSNMLEFSVDSVVHYTYQPVTKNADTWPFDEEMYLLLNIAILPSITSSFTQSSMDVDYVRYYTESPVAVTRTPLSVSPSIYPNPVNDRLNISFGTVTDKNVTVKIYDLSGKLVKTHTQSSNFDYTSISGLAKLSKGIYIVSYDLNNTTYRFKVIKH